MRRRARKAAYRRRRRCRRNYISLLARRFIFGFGDAPLSNLNQTTISAFCRLSILFCCSFLAEKTRSERRQNVLFLKMPMHKRRKRETERNMKPTFASRYQFLFGVCVPSVIWLSGAVVVCDAFGVFKFFELKFTFISLEACSLSESHSLKLLLRLDFPHRL